MASLATRSDHHAANANPDAERLTHSQLRELKADLKKASTFARRFRTYTCDFEAAISADLNTLNVSKFVGEAAQNIAACVSDGKLKAADLVSLVNVAGVVHRKYETFQPELQSQLLKLIDVSPITSEMTKKLDLTATPVDSARVRSVVRALCEFWVAGLLSNAMWLLKAVVYPLVQALEAANGHHTVNSMQLISTIVRTVGLELFRGAVPGSDDTPIARKQEQLDQYATAKESDTAKKLFESLLTKSATLGRKLRTQVEQQWRIVCEQTEIRGDDGNAEMIAKFKTVSEEVHRFISLNDSTCEALGLPESLVGEPDLSAVVASSNIDQQVVISSRLADFYTVSEYEHKNMYDDAEQQKFYEQLPSVDHLIPADQLKGAAPIADDDQEVPTTLAYDALDELLAKLPQCASIGYIDAFIEDFIKEATRYYDTPGTGGLDQARAFFRNSRLRLLNELRYAKTFAVEMVPFYARVAATLCKHFPEMVDILASKMIGDLIGTVAASASNVAGKKFRAARYIAELVKFRAAPPRIALNAMRILTESLTGENALVFASLIEHVGPFLARGGATKARLEEGIANYKKKRNATANIPTHADEAFQNACSLVANADRAQAMYKPVARRERTPVEAFVQHMLFSRLNDEDFELVRDKIRMLPWGNKGEGANVFVRLLRKVYHCAWDRVHLLVEIIADVCDVHGWVGTAVADMVLHDLRTDLEYPAQRQQQRRLQDLKFVAELYNFRVVPSSVVLYVLGQIVFYFPNPCSLRDYSRVREVGVILEAVATYLINKKTPQFTRAAFAVIMHHFYRFVHTRARPVPHDVDFRLSELLKTVDDTFGATCALSSAATVVNSERKATKKAAAVAVAKQHVLTFPKTRAEADARTLSNGVFARQRGGMCGGCDKKHEARTQRFVETLVAFIVASRGAVPSLCDEDQRIAADLQKKSDAPCVIFPLQRTAMADGAAAATAGLDDERSFSREAGPHATPLESKAPGDDDDDDSFSDDSDSSTDTDSSDSDSESDDDENTEDKLSTGTAFGREGRFTTGASWLKLGAPRRPAKHASAEQLEEDAAFDDMMRDVLKESAGDVSARLRTSAAGTQQVERSMEQRLSGVNVASASRDATMAKSAAAVVRHACVQEAEHQAATGKAPDARPPVMAVSRLAVLRRSGDKTEARSLLVPAATQFATDMRRVHEEHREEQREMKERTLAMNRAAEQVAATPSRGRGGRR